MAQVLSPLTDAPQEVLASAINYEARSEIDKAGKWTRNLREQLKIIGGMGRGSFAATGLDSPSKSQPARRRKDPHDEHSLTPSHIPELFR